MSYTLAVWAPPADAAPPADLAQADALLAQQRARGTVPQDPRFLALGRALYQRFPPCQDAPGPREVWLDGSEEGVCDRTVLVLGLRHSGRFFTAAFHHLVTQARGLGLNVHDLQSGAHYLADGRCLGDGDEITETTAETRWRVADWDATVPELRRDVAAGSAEALHDLGRCLLEGRAHHSFRMTDRVAALAMMAAAEACGTGLDPARQAFGAAARQALPAPWQPALHALVASWQGLPPPAVLKALDARAAEHQALVSRHAELIKPPKLWPAGELAQLRAMAAQGRSIAVMHVLIAATHHAEQLAELGWEVTPEELRHWQWLNAETGDASAQLRMASRLLAGAPGWPLDPAQALQWLRRARAIEIGWADALIERLARRLATPWDPVADRARAASVLARAASAQGGTRVAYLRRACELDHPEAWQQLGDAYRLGQHGLNADPLVAAALHLMSVKIMIDVRHLMDAGMRERLRNVDSWGMRDALDLARMLVAEPEPWAQVQRFQKHLATRVVIEGGATFNAQGGIDTFMQVHTPGPGGAAPARADTRQRPPGADALARRTDAPEAPEAPLWPTALLLWTGALGPVLLLRWAEPMGKLGWRAMVLLCAALAVAGAWRACAGLGWAPAVRALAAVLAAIPGVGLFVAMGVTGRLWRQATGAQRADQ